MDGEDRPHKRRKQPSSDYVIQKAIRKKILEDRDRLVRSFYEAIRQGNLSEMHRLREQALPHLVSITRPLHAAVWTDNVETLSLLLEWGEDINGCDDYGNSPLCDAVLGGHLKAIDFLLQRGADPHVVGPNWMMGSMPERGEPILRGAVYFGEEWLNREPNRVPGLCAGLACLFDRRPELLSEWQAYLHDILVVAYKASEKEQQWRSRVAEALQQRGREDLAADAAPSPV